MSNDNCITISKGKLINEATFKELVGNYESKKAKGQLNYETFSIGVLDLLKHPDGKYFRIHLGSHKDLTRLILVTIDEKGKVLRRVIDENKYEVEADKFEKDGVGGDLLMLEWGDPCPDQCALPTIF